MFEWRWILRNIKWLQMILYDDYRFLIRIMQQSSPNSTQFLQELTHQPIFAKALEEELKHEQLFESQDINQMPYAPRQRVSEKLLENRLRRIEINIHKQQQIENLLEKRKMREREISSNIRNRLDLANRKKEDNLRQSNSQQENRRKWEHLESQQRLKRFQANLEKIEKGRSKVEEKKNDYIFRIQRKTQENLKRVHQKRRVLQSVEEAENDQIHLEEWNSYKNKLVRKYEGKSKSPPDHLYQDFKQRNNLLKNMFTEIMTRQPEESIQKSVAEQAPLTSCSSAKSLIRSSKKVAYFGIHEENMMKKTVKDIEKMRQFLDKQGNYQSFGQRDDVLPNFKQFFLQEILHI